MKKKTKSLSPVILEDGQKKSSKKKKQSKNSVRMYEISLSNEFAAYEMFLKSLSLIGDDEYIYGRDLKNPTILYLKKEVSK